MNSYEVTNIYNLPTCSVDNGFMRWLYDAYVRNMLSYKIPMLLFQGGKEFGGYNTIVDILKEPGIVDKNITIYNELTNLRYKQHGGTGEPTADAREVLFVDYLLKNCICYVEIVKGFAPTKFYATRNYDLLKFMSTPVENCPFPDRIMPLSKDITSPKEEAKLRNLCSPLTLENIKDGAIKFIKLEKKRSGYSITVPRTVTVVPNTTMRITPVFFNYMTADMLMSELQTKLLRIKYFKDNMVERSVISSLNPRILEKAYAGNSEKAYTTINYANKNNITRGYITVPELLLPISDETGCRAVSFRLCSIEVLDPEQFSNPYLNIDLDGVGWSFEQFLKDYQNNLYCLQMIYLEKEKAMGTLSNASPENYEDVLKSLTNKVAQMSADMILDELHSWVEMCMMIDKTQTSRSLHTFMVNNPMLFPRYTGKLTQSSEINWHA